MANSQKQNQQKDSTDGVQFQVVSASTKDELVQKNPQQQTNSYQENNHNYDVPKIQVGMLGMDDKYSEDNPNLKEEKIPPSNSTLTDFDEDDIDEGKETVVDFSDETEASNQRKQKSKKSFPIFKFLFSIILIFFIGLSLFGVWNRWLRADDVKDIVGTWQVSGTPTVVTIDDKQIYLNKDTVFKYEIDTAAKVIFLNTGNYNGVCHYRFNWNRNQLAFSDSGNMDLFSTAFSDICWFSDFITCKMNGIGLSPAYTKISGQDVDTTNTGIEGIIATGHKEAILLERLSSGKTAQ